MNATEEVGFARTMRLLRAHVSPISSTMVFGILFLVGGSLSGLLQPLMTGRILEMLDDPGGLRTAISLLVGVLALTLTCNFFGSLLLLRATEGVVAGARDRLIRRVLSLSVGTMHRENPGELTTRITSDSSMIRVVAMTCIAQLVTGLISIVGSLIIMISLNPLLLVVTLCFLTLPGGMLLLTMPRVRLWAKRTQVAMGLMGRDLERVFGMLTTVKANGAEPIESALLTSRVEDVRDKGARTGFWRSLNSSLSMAVVQVSYLAVLGVGGVMTQRDSMSVAELVTFLMYAAQLSAPVMAIAAAVTAFQTGQAALERIAEVELLEREADTVALTVGKDDELVPGLVAKAAPGADAQEGADAKDGRHSAFTDAGFTYPGAEGPAMRRFTFDIPASGITAIVGPSGSGKSTVLRVLCGFYALETGRCVVGGRLLTDWDVKELRKFVAYVEQESPVIEGTIRSNLLYGHPDADDVSDETMLQALVDVQLGERITDLDAATGYRGGNLSGGERQRLSIARGLLREPQLLLLDECTSALDINTEQRVIASLQERAKRTPMLMVAHRLETVRSADHIALLDRGHLQGFGTHEELLESSDLYRGMVHSSESARSGDDKDPVLVAGG